MMTPEPLLLPDAAADDLRAWLRLEPGEEDPLLLALMAAAIRHAEQFTGQLLLARTVRQILNASSDWQRLAATPVRVISGVTGLPGEGASYTLPVSAYAIDIDGNGDGWVRVMQSGSAGRIEVACEAGISIDWGKLPESLRLAVLRLTGYLHANRDGDSDSGPPAAVAALLRPWRRMRLFAGGKA